MYNKISKNASSFLVGICYMQNNQLLEKQKQKTVTSVLMRRMLSRRGRSSVGDKRMLGLMTGRTAMPAKT